MASIITADLSTFKSILSVGVFLITVALTWAFSHTQHMEVFKLKHLTEADRNHRLVLIPRERLGVLLMVSPWDFVLPILLSAPPGDGYSLFPLSRSINSYL